MPIVWLLVPQENHSSLWFLKTDFILQILFCLTLSHSILIAAKTISPQMPRLGSLVVDALEEGKSINQESDKTSKLNESPTVHHRTTRNVHPCISRQVREYDWCRGDWIVKVQCKRRHPACNHAIPIHTIPKCHTVYGFRNATFVNKCSALPLDCQCAS